MYAKQNAWRAAKMKLALRPCPKCGAIDRKTVVLVAARPFVASSFAAALATFLLLAVLRWPPLGEWAFAMSPMMGAAVTGFSWVWQWQPREGDVVADP